MNTHTSCVCVYILNDYFIRNTALTLNLVKHIDPPVVETLRLYPMLAWCITSYLQTAHSCCQCPVLLHPKVFDWIQATDDHWTHWHVAMGLNSKIVCHLSTVYTAAPANVDVGAHSPWISHCSEVNTTWRLSRCSCFIPLTGCHKCSLTYYMRSMAIICTYTHTHSIYKCVCKHLTVSPVPKGPTGPCLNNYRPIVLTTKRCFGKLVITCIKRSLTHLENKDSYLGFLFLDFSSAFNTIIPQTLWNKVVALGRPISL